MTAFFDYMGINRDMLIVILAVLSIVLVVLIVIILIKTKKIFRRYDYFMRGKDAESLEDKIMEIYSRTYSLQDQDMEQRDHLKKLTSAMAGTYCKTGIVKYNAFNGMGGQSSFALVLLDHTNSGILLNAMHSRTSCYIYLKEIKNGEPETTFGDEEIAALKKAMGK